MTEAHVAAMVLFSKLGCTRPAGHLSPFPFPPEPTSTSRPEVPPTRSTVKGFGGTTQRSF